MGKVLPTWSVVTLVLALVLSTNPVFAQVNVEAEGKRSEPTVVTFGALFSLTGVLASPGTAARAGAELAVEEVNEYFANRGIPVRIALNMKDTQSDPAVALEMLKALTEEGIVPIVLGPTSSAEVEAVREYANREGILVISYASTAPSLAIADDYIFRMMPNDRSEAEALAMLARDAGDPRFASDVVIPVYRDDLFGNELVAAFTEEYTRRGGIVIEPGFAYDTGTEDFRGLVGALAEAVRRAFDTYPGARVAVYLVGFDEVANILRVADDHEPLSNAVWYGSNATAHSGAILKDEAAAAFAAKVNFLNPIFVPEIDTLQLVPVRIAEIQARLGREPETFGLLSHEIVWLMALSYLRTGMENPDGEALRSALLDLTGEEGNYRGLLGHRTHLDEAGDMQYGSTGFFALEAGQEGYRWIRRAQLYRSPYYEPYWRFDPEPDPFERTVAKQGLTADEQRITIGALLSLTDGDQHEDQRVADIRTALEMARDDINRYVANIGSPYRVDLWVEDTYGDPEIAVALLGDMAAAGITFVIGPMRSFEAAVLLPYAEEFGVILISPTSTMSLLAIPGDNLYRLVPDDRLQAAAIAELMVAEGVEAVLPFYSDDDIYAGDLVALVTEAFEAAGGTVLEGLRYASTTRDFESLLRVLDDRAAEAIGRYGADAVAVLFTGFEESLAVLTAAGRMAHLTEVRWFGSDANAAFPALVADPEAARAAASVRLTSPFFSINPFDPQRGIFLKDYEVFMARLEAEFGRVPGDFAATSYVALWWAVRAYLASGPSDDVVELRAAMEAILRPEVGLSLTHITGPVQFNEAGDPVTGGFVFYRVHEEDGAFVWREYAAYYRGYDGEGLEYR